MKFTKSYIFILLILILGFAVRVWGIGFGLPNLYHADEPIVVNHALAYGAGDLNPHFFNIPPLVSYLLFGIFGVYYLIGHLIHLFPGINEFRNLFISDPTSFYFLGRIVLGAFVGTLTVYLLYRVIQKYFSEEKALLSAFFLAFSFLHVRDSHYIYTDILLLCFLVIAFFSIFKILKEGAFADYVLFGVWAGIIVATKYNGIFIFAPFFVAHFLKRGFRFFSIFDARLFAAGLISILVYSLLNPFTWLSFSEFYRDIHSQSSSEGMHGLSHHLFYSIVGGFGIPLTLFAISGLLFCFIRPDKKRWVIASFIFVYYGILCFMSQPYDRYVLPLIPFLCFFASDFLVKMTERFKLSKSAVCCLVMILVLPSLLKIYLSDQIFSSEDIRSAASREIKIKIPEGARLALDTPFFMPRLEFTPTQLMEKRKELLATPNPSAVQIQRIDLKIQRAREKQISGYELYFLNDSPNVKFLFANPTVPYSLDALAEKNIQYVFVTKTNAGEKPEFYEALRHRGKLIARFSPYRNPNLEWAIDREPLTGGPFLWKELLERKRNGQIIEVYQI